MFLGECYYFINIAEGEAGYCIGATVVESDPACYRVVEGGTGESPAKPSLNGTTALLNTLKKEAIYLPENKSRDS
jgi:hypothetical protein